ncbi:transposase [Ktedonobacter sp. SOSP1-52]|uniref:tyrosine-type recombinase/integrase n=1 Tax=Ktedonobacter sp. SOSP1-52 TaxID=2778366 RepID=UPI001915642F|nr:tyrosine-type recombinase/integrase [Ktedonobacter sp. SOSP1-52]GHO69085.1 transposase [Ktedonobacter sp. SOSP1-52]
MSESKTLLTKAIEDFLTDRDLNNHSQKTIRTYEQRLRYFRTWIESAYKILYVDDLELIHLRGWIAYLQKTPSHRGQLLSDETIQSYGRSLLAFCHWLEQEEIIAKVITRRFKLPRVEEKFVPTYTYDDVQKLLDACEEGKGSRPHLYKALTTRNRAIVSLFVDTGIRLQELVGLRLGDVDRDMRVLLVHRKGNKWQQVPVTRDGFKPLHEYLTKYRPLLAKQAGIDITHREDAVFLGDDGKPLKYYGVAALFRRLKKRTGIDGKKVGPHNCRRYMATTQLASGRSPLDVQRQMGHRTLAMTNKYASLTIDHLKKSHERHSALRGDQGVLKEGYGTGYWDE